MNHYCNGEIIYRKELGVWECLRCEMKNITLQEFINENNAFKEYTKEIEESEYYG